MTNEEKIKFYETFLHMLQLNAEVALNAENVKKLIDNACRWSYSHRCGNGELSWEGQDKLVEKATKNLVNLDK